MNTLEQKVQLNCKYHPQNPSKYLQICRESFSLIPICSTCTKIKGLSIQQLILNEECLSADENSIITNWPPLDDQDFEVKLFQLLLEASQSNQSKQIKACYMQTFKQDIMVLLNKIQDIDFSYNHSEILRIYNQVSQKDKLRQFLTKKISEEEIQFYVQNMMQNTQNSEIQIKCALKNYERYHNVSNLKAYQHLFSCIIDQLETFVKNLEINQEEQTELDQISEQISQIQNSKTIQIQNNLQFFSEAQNNLIEKLLEKKNLNSLKINQINQKVLEIQNSMINNIYDQLSYNSQHLDTKKLLQPTQISMYQNQLFYFDYPICQTDLNKYFKIKVKKADGFLGIGILNKTDTPISQQKFSDLIQYNLYYYLISSDGFSWNQEDISQNKVQNSFQFFDKDVILVKLEKNYITFKKEFSEDDLFIMRFTYNPNKEYYFCCYRDSGLSDIQLTL
ncbi:hypothetical protein TTHERM_00673430 (macronuclear) [Tetrahymena thermophila SB210]|uniref:Uncharacterized protein n=1 Tax=Tetrahymena thermophila (strain SB210) TaxID=312017 RepID=Q23E19_TETTS|nr:hypothetical protein TTHERM_00673430 [Tetrahymena thermophila SB210]EAR94768.1 hypothetical protein TTHERM_00673430 [Tetrahymena thermophila SB210]|eukprot:XP_001015013.1 hypothetical protein TTHERM_00673430 [Tetrahymena thermophila SB210]